jgi:hypothetical protein
MRDNVAWPVLVARPLGGNKWLVMPEGETDVCGWACGRAWVAQVAVAASASLAIDRVGERVWE